MANERKVGIVISYLNILLQTIVNFVYVPILLYYIGTSEYGIYQLIGSFIAYFSIMDFGLTTAVINFYTKYKIGNNKIAMENILAIAMRCYLVITIFLVFLSFGIYYNIDSIFSYSMTESEILSAKKIFLLLIFNIICTVSTMIFRAIINAHEKFLFLKGLETIQLMLQPILVILILQEYPTAFSVAMVQTILNLCLIIARIYYCFNKLKVTIKYHYWDKKMFNAFKKLALSTFIVVIIDQVFFKTNQIILGIVEGTTAVAVYAISSLIYMNYMALSLAISGVYLPHIIELLSQNDGIKKVSDLFVNIGRWQYFLLSGIASGFIIFGKEFIYFWAGVGFEDAYWITLLIIIPFTIDLIQNLGLAILQAQNRYDFRAKVYFCMGIFNLCLAIPLAKVYGGIGCAFATGLSMFIGNGLIMNWYYWKIVGLDILVFWQNIIKITTGVVGMTIVGFIVNYLFKLTNFWIFICSLILYALFYSILMYFIFMNQNEKDKINKLILKFR